MVDFIWISQENYRTLPRSSRNGRRVQEQPRDWDWDELNLQYAAAEDAPGRDIPRHHGG